MSSTFYIVFTIKHLINLEYPSDVVVQEFKDRITLYDTAYKQFIERSLLILEYGIHGDNPHFNYVVEYKTVKDVSNVRKAMKKIYKEGEEISKNTLVCQSVVDVNSLIGGYLQKEAEKQLIFNNGYDLVQAQSKAKKIIQVKELKKKIKVYKDIASDIIIQYADQNDLEMQNDGVNSVCYVVRQMIKNNYDFSAVYGCMSAIYAEVCLKLGNDSIMDIFLTTQINRGFQG
ncbi:MAG: hypothetical protein H7836_16990 [Magnetococcus sp. YQC-3]